MFYVVGESLLGEEFRPLAKRDLKNGISTRIKYARIYPSRGLIDRKKERRCTQI